ncbi:MAG: TIGR03087 family PEP-CTERM/XrtA system glycosyltransferase, partial [Pseudomonadota bacterium]|nr:TIGR03087 family PEP-CTERM/XrtA system glycosyltransferase [Pseudomonadota bacterium]
MDELLFLTHRLPYPPNKGDKIRSWHWLRHLSGRYRVHLGTFIDDPADWRYADAVRRCCGETCLVPLHPRRARLRSLTGLLRGEALTLAYYRSAALQGWIDGLLERTAVDRVLVFSSAMAQFVQGPRYRRLRRIVDFVDVDSAKWSQYALTRPWPMSAVYRREAGALLRFERMTAAAAAASVFVSAEEAALFRQLAPEAAATLAIANGVDTDYFDPQRDYPDPYPAAAPVLAFTGAMDYWPNVDAVCWFAGAVLPLVRQALPQAQFYVVGARPAAAVRRLAARPGVTVTGAVADVRPYLAHAGAAVAPLRIARGVQNKVLEAMAMARPVLATRAAMDGILPCPDLQHLVADDPHRLAGQAVALLAEGDRGGAGRRG